ncbi:MAG: site-specific DNA-methyltransferase [Nitrosospira sp.]|nr:site-specific DNA-methyltransferase [Nitrosospira sp.]
MTRNPPSKTVEALKYVEAMRKNIPTAEYQSVLDEQTKNPTQVRYSRKYTELLYQVGVLHDLGKVSDKFRQRLNRDLDPQLVWRGKDEQDWSDLVVQAPPLYIQEKVHPKALINDLLRETRERRHETGQITPDLFADFNGIPKDADKTEFYQHDQNWSNRMILGDSLQAMASLAEREGLRGKVQCIYFDPPYGIKFNSNFQWSTTSNKVTDGRVDHITREPEQVKAFRDTWRYGVHSYLTYLRDRLTVARDLLSDSGSIFVQIGDENVHRVRALLDEVFGDENFCSHINYRTSVPLTSIGLPSVTDHILWFAKSRPLFKYRDLFMQRETGEKSRYSNVELPDGSRRTLTSAEKKDLAILPEGGRPFSDMDLASSGYTPSCTYSFEYNRKIHETSSGKSWKTTQKGMRILGKAGRITDSGRTIRYVIFHDDFPVTKLANAWMDTTGELDKNYVVQTHTRIIERCLLMATDPGDLVLDPTCGSGTTASVAEQWGRRWVTIDTSRVALALARIRIMGARYPFYLLADSREGQVKESEITCTAPSSQPVRGNIRHGFVYERVPHITLKSIANNAEIDVIWEKWQTKLEPLRAKLNEALGRTSTRHAREGEHPESINLNSRVRGNGELLAWEEWEIPRVADKAWPEPALSLHADWWKARIASQKEIDASIAAKAEFETLYDKPYPDNKKVRVAGPFTVESLSPHRMVGVDENDELIDTMKQDSAEYGAKQSFPQMILENLKTAGVQQAHKEDKITFTALAPWPGYLVCAEGRYLEGDAESGSEKRAAIFIGPEFGTVQRADLVAAAREAGDGGFDVLIACAFNYEAHATEFTKLGRIPVLKARMNADLHMAEDLKNTGKGNLFVIFGEPDIDLLDSDGKSLRILVDGKETYRVLDGMRPRVKVKGVDVFKPQTGEVISNGPDEIACWFIDTDYNEESFFVRHAYFLGANDPYSALKTTLKAEIDPDAWATLNSDTSRPFDKPKSGRIAVKVINHLGDEVMKVFKVQ